jgi:hypothetical protein
MTPEFLAAVIDTLVPGDDALPSGTRAGLDPATYVVSHCAVFDAIAAQSGTAEAFLHADESARNAVMRGVERGAPDAFRALLTAVLADYYDAQAVLAALGWRHEPPQPAGHRVAPLDDSAMERLERVRTRSKLWRNA